MLGKTIVCHLIGINKSIFQESFSESQLRKELMTKNSQFYFVTSDEDLAGYLKINLNKSIMKEENRQGVEVERIFVISGQQGRGLGRKIMDFVI
jgi:GNAT superfamily N-acetyltransferase